MLHVRWSIVDEQNIKRFDTDTVVICCCKYINSVKERRCDMNGIMRAERIPCHDLHAAMPHANSER